MVWFPGMRDFVLFIAATHIVTRSRSEATGGGDYTCNLLHAQLLNLPPNALHVCFKLVTLQYKRNHHRHQIRCSDALQTRLLVYAAPYYIPAGKLALNI